MAVSKRVMLVSASPRRGSAWLSGRYSSPRARARAAGVPHPTPDVPFYSCENRLPAVDVAQYTRFAHACAPGFFLWHHGRPEPGELRTSPTDRLEG